MDAIFLGTKCNKIRRKYWYFTSISYSLFLLFFVVLFRIAKAMSRSQRGLPPVCVYVLGWLLVAVEWLWAEHPARDGVFFHINQLSCLCILLQNGELHSIIWPTFPIAVSVSFGESSLTGKFLKSLSNKWLRFCFSAWSRKQKFASWDLACRVN